VRLGLAKGESMTLIRTGLVGLLLVSGVAGCSTAGNGDGVATAGGQSSSAAQAAGAGDQDRLVKYTQCMREHGVNMPDVAPDSEGAVRMELPDGADPVKVEAANKECKQYMPGGGEVRKADPQMVEQLRNVAKCMRDNGVTKFPDPDENGNIEIKAGPDLDPQSARFKAAEQTCARFQPTQPGQPGPANDSKGGK
jgi:hypothetical protein